MKTTRLLLSLLMVLAVPFAGAATKNIKPSGRITGLDKQGDAIYRKGKRYEY